MTINTKKEWCHCCHHREVQVQQQQCFGEKDLPSLPSSQMLEVKLTSLYSRIVDEFKKDPASNGIAFSQGQVQTVLDLTSTIRKHLFNSVLSSEAIKSGLLSMEVVDSGNEQKQSKSYLTHES